MLVIRPITRQDLDALETFALTAYAGITSLPKNRELLEEKIRISESAFAADISEPGNESYYFILEDSEHKTFAGTCGIYANSAWQKPLHFYRVDEVHRESPTVGNPRTLQVLRPIHYERAPSEICSLYLMPDYRKGGIGRLLSLSRFMFIANHLERFTNKIIAQMRGVIEKNYHSPFWDKFGRLFLDIEFSEVLRLLNEGKEFSAEAMACFPIYLELIDSEARRVLGRAHPNTRPALTMLEKEGFSWDHEVDIFDGGPKISAVTRNIRTIKESRSAVVSEVIDSEIHAERLLLSNTGLSNFRACFGHIRIDNQGHVGIHRSVAEALEIETGSTVCYVSPYPKVAMQGASNDHNPASLHQR